MAALFVAGTGTDVGKTYVAAALIRGLRGRGRAVDGLKPVVSGFDPAAPGDSDPAVLLQALGRPVTAEAVARLSPWRFRAPLAPDEAARLEGRSFTADDVITFCRARIAGAGETLLVVEAAGGIMSPLDEATTMLDLAGALSLPVVLVAGSYLGTISHTLTAVAAMREGGIEPSAVVVSESLAAPAIGYTTETLRARLAAPVFALARGGEAPEDLLDLF